MFDSILALEKPVMLFFQNLRVPFLSTVAEVITFFGEGGALILILTFIYYAIDKKKGFALLSTAMTGTVVNNTLKVIFRIPRPWVKYPGEIIPLRKSTATGYSFPSGHSTTAGVLYGSIYKAFKNRAVRIISVILMILIPLSRIYLAVHWPLDILFGIAIGFGLSFLYSSFLSLYDNEVKMRRIATIISPVMIALSFVISILIDNGVLDSTLYKDIATAFSCWGAVALASYLEKKYVSFKKQEGWLKIILCYFFSLALGAAITLLGIGSITVMHRLFKTLCYVLFVFWEIYLWPLVGIKFKLFEKA